MLKTIYDHSPIWAQNLMTSADGFRKNRSRYGSRYQQQRDFLPLYDSWTLEEKQKFQLNRLRSFLQHAHDNSAFYRERIPQEFIDDLSSLNELAELPTIDKETLRQNITDIFTVSSKNSVESHTGGTTGKSLIVRTTFDDSYERMAQLDHFKSCVGFENRKMRRASFTGKHIVPARQSTGAMWRFNHPTNQLLFSSIRLSPFNAEKYAAALNDFRPHALDGFPSAMVIVARYILAHNVKLNFKPLALFPTAETLTAEYRQVLQEAFQAPVYDQYASSEGAPFVTECSANRLHFKINSGVFELGPDGNTLVTSFTTRGTPLIRYDIGDRIVPDQSANLCECGVQEPLAQEIEGRAIDFLVRPDGARVYAGQTANILKNVNNSVVKAQFRQTDTLGVRLLLVVDHSRWNQVDLDALSSDYRDTMGSDSGLDLMYVDDITPASSGKHRLIVNSIGDDDDI